MNILFLNSMAADQWGGGEKWMVEAARGLRARGHRAYIGSKPNSYLLSRAEEVGLPTMIFHIRRDISPINTLKIARFLHRNRIDCLICNLNKDVRVGALAARCMHTPVVLARHGVKLIGRRRRKYQYTLRLVHGIITNAASIRDEYSTYGWFPSAFVRVIYNGISLPSLPVGRSVRDELGISDEMKVVLSAGRLAWQKGFDLLIQAAHYARQESRRVRFLIAGQGRQADTLRNLVEEAHLQEYVYFLGFVDDLRPYFAACDLFVLASRFEGMPNVVMEAMAMGKPVVATNTDGTRELIVHGEVGYLVPPEDSRSLWECIRYLLDHPDFAQQMGHLGRQRVQGCFSYTRMIDHLEEFLQEKWMENRRRR